MRELADVLELVERQGFHHCFGSEAGFLSVGGRQGRWDAKQARVVDVIGVDAGTDPGDDVTVYLLETDSGIRGYLLVPDSFHTDPAKAALVHALMAPARRADDQ